MGGVGVEGVPEGSRKIVKSLKEIVGCSEIEIYSMLKDCNMDPNEAVNRLLSQVYGFLSLKEVVSCTEIEVYCMRKDCNMKHNEAVNRLSISRVLFELGDIRVWLVERLSFKECNMDPNEAVNSLYVKDPFHEVKSKREKKKESKNSTEPKPRGTNNNQSSRGARGGSDHYAGRSGTQYSSSESGKPTYKKENGSTGYGSYSSVSSGTTGNKVYRPSIHSDSVTAENNISFTDTVDGGWGVSVPSSGYTQPCSWNQPVGSLSMADVVKLGRPQPSNPSTTYANHDVSCSDVEWPVAEPSTQPASDWDTVDQHLEPEQDQVSYVQDVYAENISANHDGYASVRDASVENISEYHDGYGRMQNNNSEGASHFEHEVYENMESYQPHANTVEHREVEDIGVSVSSVTSNMQQLKVADEREDLYEEVEAAVIIPDHLQVQNADCFHLSFGTFGSRSAGPTSSPPFSSRHTHGNIQEAAVDRDTPSVGHLDTRNSEYFSEESLRTGSDGNLIHRTGASAYDSPSVSQSEVLNHENQYTFPDSTNYSFENVQQLNASFAPPSHNISETQTFSNAYANSSPNSSLGPSTQSVRESDYSYTPFDMGGQSISAKYGNTISSVSSSTASMPEVLKAAGFSSSTLQTPQSLSVSDIAAGGALPQHLLQQYSQVAPFANMVGYPFLPTQSYYLPGAYQQTLANNNSAYHQSLPPQYKNSVSVSSLPQQSNAVASGYGGGSFGIPTSLPGGKFSGNQPSAPPVGYEDVLGSQYKDTSHLLSLQQLQNENQQAMWAQAQGHGSRTMSGVPANTYYNYQSQNQQQQQPPSGFRQSQQQPSQQNYGSALANSNFYHSQLLNHQLQ